MKQNKSKGYLIVASNKESFYSFAINLGESITDYYPEAKITIVTEERFLDGREKQFDNVILCDSHYRAKLWGMTQTPYDLTMYVDADMACTHEDISLAFDEIKDNDLVFTPITEETLYCFQDSKFPKGQFELNGGVCLYDTTNPLVKEFMNDWWEIYCKQFNDEWWPTDENGDFDLVNYGDRRSMKWWDQFTLWYLTHEVKKYKDLKIGIFDDWARWNYYVRYDSAKKHNKGPVVLEHYSAGVDKNSKYEGGIS